MPKHGNTDETSCEANGYYWDSQESRCFLGEGPCDYQDQAACDSDQNCAWYYNHCRRARPPAGCDSPTYAVGRIDRLSATAGSVECSQRPGDFELAAPQIRNGSIAFLSTFVAGNEGAWDLVAGPQYTGETKAGDLHADWDQDAADPDCGGSLSAQGYKDRAMDTISSIVCLQKGCARLRHVGI